MNSTLEAPARPNPGAAAASPELKGPLAVVEARDLAFLTWTANARQSVRHLAESAYEEIAAELARLGAVVLQERIFARTEAARSVLRAREAVGRRWRPAWEVKPTYLEGSPLGSAEIAGIHVVAARGKGRLLERDGQACGRIVEMDSASLLALSDVGRFVRGRGLAQGAEARETLRAAEDLLVGEGWGFGDVARTWFYLRDILGWYGGFNRARNDEFRRMGLLGGPLQGLIPASTGIEGRNALGGWCTLDLLAARPRGGARFEMRRLTNRRQNEATAYGSAFARGLALTLGEVRYIFVSGTASIDDHGASVHPGDFEAQTRATIETVESLLAGAGASLRDVRQATAFVKRPSDARAFSRIAEGAGLLSVPTVAMIADVCRDELLFELDAAAVVAAEPREAAAPSEDRR